MIKENLRKVYLSGKITGDPFYKIKFQVATEMLISKGYSVMNPATMPDGFLYEEYMRVCQAMVDVCDGICLLPCWESSPGSKFEKLYAEVHGKTVLYHEEVAYG